MVSVVLYSDFKHSETWFVLSLKNLPWVLVQGLLAVALVLIFNTGIILNNGFSSWLMVRTLLLKTFQMSFSLTHALI